MSAVQDCVHCAKNCVCLRKRASAVKLFSAYEPLESVTIDILKSLPESPRGFQYINVIADWFTKLVQVVPMRLISLMDVAQAFLDYWVYKYRLPKTLLSDNGKQFSS